MLCDCPDHPECPPRCCPTRGRFGCVDNKFHMPALPAGIECQHFIAPINVLSKKVETEWPISSSKP